MVKSIPTPKSLPLFGTLLSLIKEGGGPKLHKYVDKRHKQLGPTYKEKIGPIEAYFISDPKDMRKVFANEGQHPVHILPECWTKYNELYGCKRGLYFMDGEEWQKYRRILNQYMLKNYSHNTQKYLTHDLLKTFSSEIMMTSNNNNSVDFEPLLYKLSIYFVISNMLGTPFIKHYLDLENDIDPLSKTVHKIFDYSVELSLLPINLSVALKLPAWRNFVGCVDNCIQIGSVIYDKVAQLNGDGLIAKLKEENVSQDIIRQIVIDFILAAGDTTALSTVWTLYLLGRNQPIQDELFNEMNQTGFDSLQSETLNNIIKETMRLYPIGPFLTRYIPTDIEIGDYTIPAKSLVILSIYSSSHDSKYFPSPNDFKPERWLRQNKNIDVMDPYASIPFAMGARSCIGRKLAHTQMCLTISQIIYQYKVNVEQDVEMVLRLITVPAKPIQFNLQPRIK